MKQFIKLVAVVGFSILLLKPTAPINKKVYASPRPIAVVDSKPQIVEEPAKVETPAPVPEATPEPVTTAPVVVPSVTTDKQSLMQQAGIAESDYNAVDYIVSHESGWRVSAVNASSGATGLCQSLPASKMASEGEDYMTNPVTQLRWCSHYATQRYGSWWLAQAFWSNARWW